MDADLKAKWVEALRSGEFKQAQGTLHDAKHDLREYRKMRYMGDCKCGNCQLIPLTVIDEQILHIDRLTDLVKTLIENDPDAPIADNGKTVLDGWRERANRVLASSGERQDG